MMGIKVRGKGERVVDTLSSWSVKKESLQMQ